MVERVTQVQTVCTFKTGDPLAGLALIVGVCPGRLIHSSSVIAVASAGEV